MPQFICLIYNFYFILTWLYYKKYVFEMKNVEHNLHPDRNRQAN